MKSENPSVGPFVRITKPEDLLCKVTAREQGSAGLQATVQNNHRGIRDWDREYVEFSGFFGVHGPEVFAAAPELLEACENWISWLDPDAPWRDDAADHEATMLDAMRAAIAKARGLTERQKDTDNG